jgi:predicted CXXCH cytochrome family protein
MTAFCVALTAAGGAATSKSAKLVVLYSNQAYGQIRSCNCTKFRYGGYGREMTLAEQVRKENPNLIIIEGGDAVGQQEADQDRLKSDVAVEAMGIIGYTAFVPGDAELRYDRKSIEGWMSKSKTPFVLANAKFKDSGKPVCSRPFVVQELPNGRRVAVVGVVGMDLFPDMMQMGMEIEITDPAAALKSLLPKVRSQADFVIVAAHASADKAKELAKLSGVDLLLCTHSFDKLTMPEKDKNVVEGTTEKIGKCMFVTSHSRSGWSVGRLDLEFDDKTVKASRNRMVFLDRTYEEHPSLVKLYDKYNTDVAAMLASQQNAMKSQFAELLKARGIDPSKRQREKVFAGSEACKACHEDSYSAWAKSRHATAFASLERTGQGSDPECVRCHVTGASVRGGFSTAKDTPELANVQCEACHGAGISHGAKPAAGFGAVSEELCRSCHTEAFNPDFDFEQMVDKIQHKKKQ